MKASKRQTRELLAWAERFPVRRWAVESANGHGYLLAQQLVAAGEHVVDLPSTLASRARVLDSRRSQKNDANDARSVAIVTLHQGGLRRVEAEDHVAVLGVLAGRHKPQDHKGGDPSLQRRLSDVVYRQLLEDRKQ